MIMIIITTVVSATLWRPARAKDLQYNTNHHVTINITTISVLLIIITTTQYYYYYYDYY